MSSADERLTPWALKGMPKIDLHRHLEGSLRLETLFDIARQYNNELPYRSLRQLRPLVQVVGSDPPDYELFLDKFKILRNFYRSPEIIQRVAYEAVADAAADNIHYLEMRFSPQAQARACGYPLEDVTAWVVDSVQQAARDFKIQVGLIVTLVRHDPFDQAKLVADVAIKRAGNGIHGLDLAGDEVKFPLKPFMPIFDAARSAGLGITVHAGEWASAESVKLALEELQPDRIGHGVRTIENSRVVRMARKRGVAFEVCLTSNLQTGVVHKMDHHPLLDMMHLGLIATINTDDPCLSNITLTDEYQIAVDRLGFTYASLRQLILNGATSAFLPADERRQLVAHFEKLLPA